MIVMIVFFYYGKCLSDSNCPKIIVQKEESCLTFRGFYVVLESNSVFLEPLDATAINSNVI